mmetsp:Transcript_19034/g.39655  ORF Transcript_19034/g.39655 Transcript_19034/m.39655 type:complete len:327 (-) Transcript_19034:515-1495(-)
MTLQSPHSPLPPSFLLTLCGSRTLLTFLPASRLGISSNSSLGRKVDSAERSDVLRVWPYTKSIPTRDPEEDGVGGLLEGSEEGGFLRGGLRLLPWEFGLSPREFGLSPREFGLLSRELGLRPLRETSSSSFASLPLTPPLTSPTTTLALSLSSSALMMSLSLVFSTVSARRLRTFTLPGEDGRLWEVPFVDDPDGTRRRFFISSDLGFSSFLSSPSSAVTASSFFSFGSLGLSSMSARFIAPKACALKLCLTTLSIFLISAFLFSSSSSVSSSVLALLSSSTLILRCNPDLNAPATFGFEGGVGFLDGGLFAPFLRNWYSMEERKV